MKSISAMQAHQAEIDRLRRIRMNEPLLCHVEVTEDEVEFLSIFFELNAKQKQHPESVAHALKAFLAAAMAEPEEETEAA